MDTAEYLDVSRIYSCRVKRILVSLDPDELRDVRSHFKFTHRPEVFHWFVFQHIAGKGSTLEKLDVHLKFGFLQTESEHAQQDIILEYIRQT